MTVANLMSPKNLLARIFLHTFLYMTITDARRAGAKLLHPYSDAPDIDAQRLLMKVVGVSSPAYLISHADEALAPAAHGGFQRLIEERKTGKPLAYILGWAEFYGRRFTVNEHVLIPRPVTEDLIEHALPAIEKLSRQLGRRLVVADIGTGSGCIAITLALESPAIGKLYATDVSAEALVIAAKNAQRMGVTGKVEFLHGDMLKPVSGKNIDLVVSNPPYVPTGELEKPPTAETRGLVFEPRQALDGGVDGLMYVKQIEASGIPAVVETVGGTVETYNMQ